jgi:hypothetical protein
MNSRYIRNHPAGSNLIKRLFGALPLSMKRHLLYAQTYRRWGNFRSPLLFSEKMQWRIINDRRTRLRPTCDKRASKHVAETIARAAGLQLRIPHIISWGSTSDEMVRALMESAERGTLPGRWVLKPNNSSGHVLLVEGAPDWVHLREAMNAWPLQRGGVHWIWPYEVAARGFIAEEWVGSTPASPIELSATMVGGRLAYWWVQQEALTGFRRSHFDGNGLPVEAWSTRHGLDVDLGAPKEFIARALPYLTALAEGWDLIRIDLYYADDTFWFGEFTPFQSDGLNGGAQFEWFDRRVGAMWALPPIETVREGKP